VNPPNLRLLTVGRSGNGKTQGMLSWARHPETSPVHVLSLDRRVALLDRTENVTYDIFDASMGYLALDNKLAEYKTKRSLPFKTLLVCGLTALLDLLIVEGGNLLQKISEKGQKIGSLYIPGPRDYLYASEAIRQIFYNGLFQFNCNVIVEANVANAYDSAGNVKGDRILATDKIAEKIPTFFDEIWEFDKRLDTVVSKPPHYEVAFSGSLGRTGFEHLQKANRIEWTGKDLWETLFGDTRGNKDSRS